MTASSGEDINFVNQTSSGNTSNMDSTTGNGDEIIFSSTQQIVLTLVPMFSGLISVVGSYATLYVIYMDRKQTSSNRHHHHRECGADVVEENNNPGSSSIGMNNIASKSIRRMSQMMRNSLNSHDDQFQPTEPLTVYQRIMIGLSISDLISAVRASTTSFLLPSDTVGVWKAFGNTATCSFQGFFSQLGVCSLLYTTSLSIYFYLTIVPNVNADTMKRRIEPLLHTVPILFGVLTSTIGLFYKAYNPVRLSIYCWISPYPTHCLDDDNDVECIRGEKTQILRILFSQAPLLICFVIIVVCMVSIFISVRQQIRKMEFRYGGNRIATNSNSSTAPITSTQTSPTGRRKSNNNILSNRSQKRLQKVATQSQLYILVFCLVYFWNAVGRGLEFKNNTDGKFFFVSLLSLVFYPLQGFFNFFIYVRPRTVQLRTVHPTLSWIQSLRIVLRFDKEPEILIRPQVAATNERLKNNNGMNVNEADATTLIDNIITNENNNNEEPERMQQSKIQNSWSNGLDDATNGSTDPVLETNSEIVHDK